MIFNSFSLRVTSVTFKLLNKKGIVPYRHCGSMATKPRPKILVTHPNLPQSAIDLLEESCDIVLCNNPPGGVEPTREEILNKCKGVDGMLWATHCPLNAEILDAAGPQVISISAKSAGIDYIDVSEVKRRGIPLGYTPGVLNDAVADIAVGLIIAASRRFREGQIKIEKNEWEQGNPNWLLGRDISGSTVGIVGLGGIGQVVLKRLKGFNVGQFIYTGHKPKPEGDILGAKFTTFDDLLKISDFVVVTCPLSTETKNLFSTDAFSKMKPTSVFINVSRGAIVDQHALIDALKTNKIFAAGLDVTVPEPLPPDHPLLKLHNCFIVPHLGSATTNTRFEMAVVSVKNVLNGLNGKPMIYPAY